MNLCSDVLYLKMCKCPLNREQNFSFSSHHTSCLYSVNACICLPKQNVLESFSKRSLRMTKSFIYKKVKNIKTINPCLMKGFTTYLKHWGMLHGCHWQHFNDKMMSAIPPPIQPNWNDKLQLKSYKNLSTKQWQENSAEQWLFFPVGSMTQTFLYLSESLIKIPNIWKVKAKAFMHSPPQAQLPVISLSKHQ